VPTLVAVQYNPVIRRFYSTSWTVAKPKMVALITAMRKLLAILNILNRRYTDKL